jgi:hypothetical protein
VDQNAPPAGLIAIATRNLPVGAISSFKESACTEPIIINKAPVTTPARCDCVNFIAEFIMQPSPSGLCPTVLILAGGNPMVGNGASLSVSWPAP